MRQFLPAQLSRLSVPSYDEAKKRGRPPKKKAVPQRSLQIGIFAPHCAVLHRQFFYLPRINIVQGNCRKRGFFREIFEKIEPCPIFLRLELPTCFQYLYVCAPD